ncbi:MAG: helix-turn-helix domain-containing protein [Litorilinea sp.]
MARQYKKRVRAEQEEETRVRIVEATVALHQAIGGVKTSIRAIAERAGVERATVYRHFPDERTLLEACTGHYIAQNPPPNPQTWAEIAEPARRLDVALHAIYTYHRQTEAMSARAAIDVPQIPTLREVLAPMFAYWEQVRAVLACGWSTEESSARQITAAIGHACAFQTWFSLVREQGLDDADAARMMQRMVCCVARQP